MLSRTGSATVPSSPVPQILPQAPAVSELPSRLSLLVLGDDSVPPARGASVTFSRHSPCNGNMGSEGYDPCGDSMEPATLERIAGHNRCWDCHLETDAGKDGFVRQRSGAIRQQPWRGERSPQAGRFGRREYAIERGPFRPGSGRQAAAERLRNCDSAERVLPAVETWLRSFLLRAQQNGDYPCSHIAVRLPQWLLPAQKRGTHYAERTIRAAIAAISRHCFAIAPSPYSSALSARRSNIFGASRP